MAFHHFNTAAIPVATNKNNSSPSSTSSSHFLPTSPLDHLDLLSLSSPAISGFTSPYHPFLQPDQGSGSLPRSNLVHHSSKSRKMTFKDRLSTGSTSADDQSLSSFESEDSNETSEAYYSEVLPSVQFSPLGTPPFTSVLDQQPTIATPPGSDGFSQRPPTLPLLGVSKGSASLLSHDVIGSPVDGLSNTAKEYHQDSFPLHSRYPCSRSSNPTTPSHEVKLMMTSDGLSDRCQESSQKLRLNSQIGFQRHISPTSKFPPSLLSHFPTTQPQLAPPPHQRSFTQPSDLFGNQSLLSDTNPPPLRHRTISLNLTSHPVSERRGNRSVIREAEHLPDSQKSVRSLSEYIPSLPSIASIALPPLSPNFQQVESARLSTTHDRLNSTSPHSNLHPITPWSDPASVRRHRSMNSDRRWATGMNSNSPLAGKQSEDSSQSRDSGSITLLDTFHEAPSPPNSAELMRSTNSQTAPSHHPSAFSQNLSSKSSPSFNAIGHPTRSGSVTPIGSPVSVPAFSANPWSPTVEEVKKLREPMLRQTSIDSFGSGRSPSPAPMTKRATTMEANRLRSGSGEENKSADLNMLHSNFNRLALSPSDEMNARANLSNGSHRATTGKSPLSISTSMADVVAGITSPQDLTSKSSGATKKMILPPLVTSFPRQTSSPSAAAVSTNQPANETGKRHTSTTLPFQGPASAAAYVPPIGHSLQHNLNDPFNLQEKLARMGAHSTAAPGIGASTWLSQKERLVGAKANLNTTRDWNSPLLSAVAPLGPQSAAPLSALPHQIHQQLLLNQQLQQLQQLQAQQQLLQQQQVQLLSQGMGLANPLANLNLHAIGNGLPNSSYSPSLGFQNNYGSRNVSPVGPAGPLGFGTIGSANHGAPAPNPSRLQTTITGHHGGPLAMGNINGSPSHIHHSNPTPVGMRNPGPSMSLNGAMTDALPGPTISPSVDIQQLANRKGYNPVNFDLNPKSARFFVIKSYTEEDVHKSLKYEIWASTDLGNKRLDKAFTESADAGPIYLLFSVNASGHFCGMAEMLTAVDYNTSSKVWAQDKWKGIFKVRWVFVKDVPNNALRHIKLSNTPENKPVTSSRDTQEVPYEKGIEVLQIMSAFHSRTTLLQDYAWYEHNESLKAQNVEPGTSTHEPSTQSNQRQKPTPPQTTNVRHTLNAPPPNQTPRRQSYTKPGSQPQNIRRFAVANSPSAYHAMYQPIEIASVI